MISLKQLRYFETLARTGHFGRAAVHCAVTQPALSMQIQQFENELGIKLLERGRAGVMLTPAGRAIATRAAKVLTEVRDLVEFARGQDDEVSGPLQFGVIPSIAPYILPSLLPRIRDRYPALDLHLRETQTHHLLQGLREGQLDLLLLALPIDDPNVETICLFDDNFVLATSLARKSGNGPLATADMLRRDRLLLLEEGHCLRDQALTFCNADRVHHLDTSGASSLSTIVQMVANGLGVTLLPELSLKVESRQGDIHLMRFADPQPKRVIGLAWRRLSHRKRQFVELGNLITTVALQEQRHARQSSATPQFSS